MIDESTSVVDDDLTDFGAVPHTGAVLAEDEAKCLTKVSNRALGGCIN